MAKIVRRRVPKQGDRPSQRPALPSKPLSPVVKRRPKGSGK